MLVLHRKAGFTLSVTAVNRWMISTQQHQASRPMHRVENWEWSKWQRASPRGAVEVESKAHVHLCYSNLYHFSSRVLNVMRKYQPTGKIQFLTRFAIIRSSWGCTVVWRALMECQRKGQTMQILFVQPNHYPFAETVPPSPCHFFCLFFFETPSFECHWQRTFSTTTAKIPAGWDHTLFQSTSRDDDVCRWTKRSHDGLTQHSDWKLMMLVFLLLYITPGIKTLKCAPYMVLDYKDSSLDIRSIVYPLNGPWE